MYIVAMWLRAPKDGSQGVNVVIRKHPAGLPYDGDVEKIIRDPGGEAVIVRYDELPRGGNRVQATLDLVLEDKDYDRTAVLHALNEFGQSGLGTGIPEPLTIDKPLGQGRLRGIFMTNLGPMTPQSTQAVFSLLAGTIHRALIKFENQPKSAA